MTGPKPSSVQDSRDSLDLERFLPYRLSVLSNRISSAIADVYADRFGIGVTEWRTIAVLGQHPGLSANGVVQRTAMDKVAVSRAVASLLAKRLVLRDHAVDDRRRSVLRLSRAGRKLHAQVAPLALQMDQTLLSGLSPADRRRLHRLLSQLERSFPAPT